MEVGVIAALSPGLDMYGDVECGAFFFRFSEMLDQRRHCKMSFTETTFAEDVLQVFGRNMPETT